MDDLQDLSLVFSADTTEAIRAVNDYTKALEDNYKTIKTSGKVSLQQLSDSMSSVSAKMSELGAANSDLETRFNSVKKSADKLYSTLNSSKSSDKAKEDAARRLEALEAERAAIVKSIRENGKYAAVLQNLSKTLSSLQNDIKTSETAEKSAAAVAAEAGAATEKAKIKSTKASKEAVKQNKKEADSLKELSKQQQKTAEAASGNVLGRLSTVFGTPDNFENIVAGIKLDGSEKAYSQIDRYAKVFYDIKDSAKELTAEEEKQLSLYESILGFALRQNNMVRDEVKYVQTLSSLLQVQAAHEKQHINAAERLKQLEEQLSIFNKQTSSNSIDNLNQVNLLLNAYNSIREVSRNLTEDERDRLVTIGTTIQLSKVSLETDMKRVRLQSEYDAALDSAQSLIRAGNTSAGYVKQLSAINAMNEGLIKLKANLAEYAGTESSIAKIEDESNKLLNERIDIEQRSIEYANQRKANKEAERKLEQDIRQLERQQTRIDAYDVKIANYRATGQELKALETEMSKYQTQMVDVNRNYKEGLIDQDGYNEQLEKSEIGYRNAQVQAEAYKKALKDMADAAKLGQIGTMSGLFGITGQTIKQYEADISMYQTAIRQLQVSLDDGRITQEQYNAEFSKQSNAYAAASLRLDAYKKALKDKTEQEKLAKKAVSDHNALVSKLSMALQAAIHVFNIRTVVRGYKELVVAASDFVEANQKLMVIFKDMQEEAADAVARISSSYGQSTTEAMNLLSYSSNILTNFGMAQDSALDLSETLAAMAVDLVSFTNSTKTAEQALEILSRALLGERKSLRQFGIGLVDEDIKKMAKSLGIATDEMSRETEALLTLRVLMVQTGNAQGDFARTQDQLANQLRITKSAWEDLKITLGESLIPEAKKGLLILQDIIGAVEELPASLTILLAVLPAVAAVIITIGDALRRFNITAAATKVLTAGFVTLLSALAAAAAAIGIGRLLHEANDTEDSVNSLSVALGNYKSALDAINAQRAASMSTPIEQASDAMQKLNLLTMENNKLAMEKARIDARGSLDDSLSDYNKLVKAQSEARERMIKYSKEFEREKYNDFLNRAAEIGVEEALTELSDQKDALDELIQIYTREWQAIASTDAERASELAADIASFEETSSVYGAILFLSSGQEAEKALANVNSMYDKIVATATEASDKVMAADKEYSDFIRNMATSISLYDEDMQNAIFELFLSGKTGDELENAKTLIAAIKEMIATLAKEAADKAADVELNIMNLNQSTDDWTSRLNKAREAIDDLAESELKENKEYGAYLAQRREALRQEQAESRLQTMSTFRLQLDKTAAHGKSAVTYEEVIKRANATLATGEQISGGLDDLLANPENAEKQAAALTSVIAEMAKADEIVSDDAIALSNLINVLALQTAAFAAEQGNLTAEYIGYIKDSQQELIDGISEMQSELDRSFEGLLNASLEKSRQDRGKLLAVAVGSSELPYAKKLMEDAQKAWDALSAEDRSKATVESMFGEGLTEAETEYLESLLEVLRLYEQKRLGIISDAETERHAINEEWRQKTLELNDASLADTLVALETERRLKVAEAKQTGADVELINEFYRSKALKATEEWAKEMSGAIGTSDWTDQVAKLGETELSAIANEEAAEKAKVDAEIAKLTAQKAANKAAMAIPGASNIAELQASNLAIEQQLKEAEQAKTNIEIVSESKRESLREEWRKKTLSDAQSEYDKLIAEKEYYLKRFEGDEALQALVSAYYASETGKLTADWQKKNLESTQSSYDKLLAEQELYLEQFKNDKATKAEISRYYSWKIAEETSKAAKALRSTLHDLKADTQTTLADLADYEVNTSWEGAADSIANLLTSRGMAGISEADRQKLVDLYRAGGDIQKSGLESMKAWTENDYKALLELLKAYAAKEKSIRDKSEADKLKTQQDWQAKINGINGDTLKGRLEALEEERKLEIAALQKTGEETLKVEEYYKRKRTKLIDDYFTELLDAAKAFSTKHAVESDNPLAAIMDRYSAELKEEDDSFMKLLREADYGISDDKILTAMNKIKAGAPVESYASWFGISKTDADYEARLAKLSEIVSAYQAGIVASNAAMNKEISDSVKEASDNVNSTVADLTSDVLTNLDSIAESKVADVWSKASEAIRNALAAIKDTTASMTDADLQSYIDTYREAMKAGQEWAKPAGMSDESYKAVLDMLTVFYGNEIRILAATEAEKLSVRETWVQKTLALYGDTLQGTLIALENERRSEVKALADKGIATTELEEYYLQKRTKLIEDFYKKIEKNARSFAESYQQSAELPLDVISEKYAKALSKSRQEFIDQISEAYKGIDAEAIMKAIEGDESAEEIVKRLGVDAAGREAAINAINAYREGVAQAGEALGKELDEKKIDLKQKVKDLEDALFSDESNAVVDIADIWLERRDSVKEYEEALTAAGYAGDEFAKKLQAFKIASAAENTLESLSAAIGAIGDMMSDSYDNKIKAANNKLSQLKEMQDQVEAEASDSGRKLTKKEKEELERRNQQYEDAITQQEEVIKNLEKEQFERSKGISMANAVISGIEAALNAYKVGNSLGGPVVGAILAGISTAFTSAQIALLAAQQPSYAVGAYNLPQDQLAQVHKGEMIIPKPFAEEIRDKGGIGGEITVNVYGGGNDASVEESISADEAKQIDIFVSGKVKSMVARGELDNVLQSRYTLSRSGRRG